MSNQIDYTQSTEETSMDSSAILSYDELLQENRNLKNQVMTLKFALDQSNATRDDYTDRYTDVNNRNVWLEEQVETHKSRAEYITRDNEWATDIDNNPTIDPAKKTVLRLLYPFAKAGEWFPVFIGRLSERAGMKYYGTFSKHMQEMGDLGIIEVKGNTWFTGEKTKKGEPKYKTEVVIKFSEELLRFPGEIHIEKEDNRKNNGKGGGKNAKPKSCPECKSIQIDDLDMCRCRACNHQWKDGPSKDANRDAKVTPWDYGQVDEDASEIVEEEKTENATSQSPTPVGQNPRTTLFPIEKKEPEPIPFHDGRPAPPICPKCGEAKDTWEETFEYWLCRTCTNKKE